jgi:Zn-dependent protease
MLAHPELTVMATCAIEVQWTPLQNAFKCFRFNLYPLSWPSFFTNSAHGWVANYWGDNTAKANGRLTLNPIPHMDPLGTVLFPPSICSTGPEYPFWVGQTSTPINPQSIPQNGVLDSFGFPLAGPGMNFFLAIASAFYFLGTQSVGTFHLLSSRSLCSPWPYVGVTLNLCIGDFLI